MGLDTGSKARKESIYGLMYCPRKLRSSSFRANTLKRNFFDCKIKRKELEMSRCP